MPILEDKEVAYLEWRDGREEDFLASAAFFAGWDGACSKKRDSLDSGYKAGQLDRAKSEVRSELQQKLLVIAVECFKLHDHTRARFYQDLADEKHSIWSK